MDVTLALAENIINTNYDKLHKEAIGATKKDILDTLAALLAGSGGLGSMEIVDLVRELGGREESHILVYGGKVPCTSAAFVNGTMTHASEFDDTHDLAVLHAGAPVLSAALATAERKGGVNGKQFITSVALGVDLMCRMGVATKNGPIITGWHYTSTYGYFGAAAAASKILGHSQEKVTNALGLAYSQAAGNGECVVDGSLAKRVQAGLAARGGVFSALLADRGITGARRSLEGDKGLYNVYLGGQYDPEALTFELGRRFEVTSLSYKPYPCCRFTHPFIDAVLQLLRQHNIQPRDIEEIVTFIGGEGTGTVCYPLEVKREPRTVVDAQMSLPYTVATAMLKGKVRVKDFTPEAIRDPQVLAMSQKVRPVSDVTLHSRAIEKARVEIRMRGQERALSAEVEFAKGHPKNPMTFGDIADKFRECALSAARPLQKENIERVIEVVNELEDLDDMSEISRLLS